MFLLSARIQYHQFNTLIKGYTILQVYYLQITTSFNKLPIFTNISEHYTSPTQIFITRCVSINQHTLRIHWENYHLHWSHHNPYFFFNLCDTTWSHYNCQHNQIHTCPFWCKVQRNQLINHCRPRYKNWSNNCASDQRRF